MDSLFPTESSSLGSFFPHHFVLRFFFIILLWLLTCSFLLVNAHRLYIIKISCWNWFRTWAPGATDLSRYNFFPFSGFSIIFVGRMHKSCSLDFSLLTNLYFLCWRKIRKKLYSSRYWKLLPFQTFKIGYLVSLSTHALFVKLSLKLLGLDWSRWVSKRST
jgi:hypothetical protein